MLKVYHLHRQEPDSGPDFDEVEGFVVVAESTQAARELVASPTYCGDEGSMFWMTSHALVTQIGFALLDDEIERVILRSMH